MTKEELAALLNGNEYRKEISLDLEKRARESGLVVVFGASDDLCEFRGAFDDEVGAPGVIPITKDGVLENECINCDCPYHAARIEAAPKIEAIWGEPEADWTYKTDIPRDTFDIYDEGEVYCQGIVFSLEDVK